MNNTNFKSTGANLLSTSSLVETPFITVEIEGHVFGKYTGGKSGVKTQFPNYIESLEIMKINGSVNTYTLTLIYPLQPGNDPNMFEKVFGHASTTRKMKLSYGDYSVSNQVFRNEEAIITEVRSNVDFRNGCLRYTVKGTSTGIGLLAGTHNFSARYAKPSTIIKEIIDDQTFGVAKVLPGMANSSRLMLNNMLATDDKPVQIEAKQGMSTLDYLNYLTRCMSPESGASGVYKMAVVDDMDSEFGGAYFKIVKAGNDGTTNDSLDTYQIDIGYPDASPVIDFSLNNSETPSILFDYANTINSTDYSYNIDSNGKLAEIYAPAISNSATLMRSTAFNENWWQVATSFPVTATLTIRGLLRPSILCSYVRLSSIFFGNEFATGSGLWIITKQIDTINTSGFKTTLSLLRIDGDSSMQSGNTLAY